MCIACFGLPSSGSHGPLTHAAFGSGLAAAGAPPATAQTGVAALLIQNAKIVTLDPAMPTVDAITANRIPQVDWRRDLQDPLAPATGIIDADRRTIVPGLNDSHAHFIRGGLTYAQELRWDGVPLLTIAPCKPREPAQRTPAPHWVQVVGGWPGVQFAERRLPTLEEINTATGGLPACVRPIDDRAFANRASLLVLGITRDTADPFGGWLDRDGNLTGLVVNVTNFGALPGISARIPKLPPADHTTSTQHCMRELSRFGITLVVDADGGQNDPDTHAAIAPLTPDPARRWPRNPEPDDARRRHLRRKIGFRAKEVSPIGRIRQPVLRRTAGTDGDHATGDNPVGRGAMARDRPHRRLHGAQRSMQPAALRLYGKANVSMTREEDRQDTLATGRWADLAVSWDDPVIIPDDRTAPSAGALTMTSGWIGRGAGGFTALASAGYPGLAADRPLFQRRRGRNRPWRSSSGAAQACRRRSDGNLGASEN